MKKSNLILASVLAIIFTSILIIFSPTSQKTSLSSPTPSPVSTKSISPTPDPTADWKIYENKEYGFSFKYPQELGLKIQSIDKIDDEVQLFNPDNNQLINIEYLPNFFCPVDSCELLTPITFGKNTFVPIETEIGQSYIVNDIYRIWVNTDDDINNISPQILSTFKFTDSSINWKTYTNTKYGFSFKYPSDLTISENKDGMSLRSKLDIEQPGGGPTFLFGYVQNSSISEYIKKYTAKVLNTLDYNNTKFTYITINGELDTYDQLLLEKNGDLLIFSNNPQILSTFKFL